MIEGAIVELRQLLDPEGRELRTRNYSQSQLFTPPFKYLQDELWDQSEAEAAVHFKVFSQGTFAGGDENFLRISLPLQEEKFWGAGRYVKFVRAILRQKWTCQNVVFEFTGSRIISRLRSYFRDYVGQKNCLQTRYKGIYPYKVSVFNPLTDRKYMLLDVDVLNNEDE